MVTVESIKPISNAGNLRAFAIITLAGKVRIADVRVIQQPGKSAWVSMPSRAYESNGERKWSPTVELLDEDLRDEVSAAVLQEFSKLNTTSEPAKVPARW